MKRLVCLAIMGCCIAWHTAAADDYYVVLASFGVEDAASEVVAGVNVANAGAASVLEGRLADKSVYRVVLGPFAGLETAEGVRVDAVAQGYQSVWIFSLAKAPQPDHAVPPATKETVHVRRGLPEDLNRGVRPELKRMIVDDIVGARIDNEKVLPPLQKETGPRISQQEAFFLKDVSIDTPFLDAEIEALIDPYRNRTVTVEELFALRNDINELCVVSGYINSGVNIPDQRIEDGVIRFDMVAGELASVHVTSRLREGYVTDRLKVPTPFNLRDLQSSLKLLEKNRLVDRIHARVEPGEKQGAARLDLDVDTTRFYHFGITAANNRSPSIGSEYAELTFQADNLLTLGDSLILAGAGTEGLNSHRFEWQIPFNRFDHAFVIGHSVTDATVIEEPFNTVDIQSETESIKAGLILPVMRTISSELSFEVIGEKRRNLTKLLGLPFSFSEGAINGESRVTPLRIAVSYVHQGISQSFAGRFVVSHGLSSFDATDNATQADGDFGSYLLQLQYSRQLFERFHMTARGLAQVASDPLMSVEKFALGGQETVRGYRQNQIVRDDAYFASIEGRYRFDVPGRFEFVTFADWGAGKNNAHALTTDRDSISSVGLGLSWRSVHGVRADLYWAHPFKDVLVSGHDLQDDGIHFLLAYDYAF